VYECELINSHCVAKCALLRLGLFHTAVMYASLSCNNTGCCKCGCCL